MVLVLRHNGCDGWLEQQTMDSCVAKVLHDLSLPTTMVGCPSMP